MSKVRELLTHSAIDYRIAKLWVSQAENITVSQTQQLMDSISKSAVGLFIAGSSGTSRSMICVSEENLKISAYEC